MLDFFLPMNPPTMTYQTGRIVERNGKVVRYPSPGWAAARAKLESSLVPFRPPEPLDGPLRLTVKWIWQNKRARLFRWKATRPDCDNLAKGFNDCMTRLGFWHDDAQIASLVVEKAYGPQPGIYVVVEQL